MTKQILFIIFFSLFSIISIAQVKMKKIADLSNSIQETSGLVFYQNEYLITHNDGGNKSEIFVLDLKGQLVKKIDVEDTKNRDWEDLTQDPNGRLYIGDFGNNENERKRCQIYILPSGFINKKDVDPKKISFTYEDQKDFPPKKEKRNYDCEAFFWMENNLYLITKCRTKPYTGEARIYRVPAKPGKYKAKYLGSIFLGKKGWRFSSVTGADYNAESNTLAILTYSKVYFVSNFEGHDFWRGTLSSYPLPIVKQREAICFKNEKTLFMTDEKKKGLGGGNLYELKLKQRK